VSSQTETLPPSHGLRLHRPKPFLLPTACVFTDRNPRQVEWSVKTQTTELKELKHSKKDLALDQSSRGKSD
jgi:hypothetical protein